MQNKHIEEHFGVQKLVHIVTSGLQEVKQSSLSLADSTDIIPLQCKIFARVRTYQGILQLIPRISSSCLMKTELKIISDSIIFRYIIFMHGRPRLFRLPSLFTTVSYFLLRWIQSVQILTDVHNVLQDNIGSILSTHCPGFQARKAALHHCKI